MMDEDRVKMGFGDTEQEGKTNLVILMVWDMGNEAREEGNLYWPSVLDVEGKKGVLLEMAI